MAPLAIGLSLIVPAVAQAAPFVHGTLYDDTGKAMPSTLVTIYLDHLPDASQTTGVALDTIATTTTDASGNFSVSVVSPDTATQTEMANHGGWANFIAFANGPQQQATLGFSRTYDATTGEWGDEDGAPVTTTTDPVDGRATAQPATNLQPAGGGAHCTIDTVGDYWSTWNPIVRVHMGEHMTGSVGYKNDHNSSMQTELSTNEIAWGSSSHVHLQSSSLDHSTPLSGAVSATIRANINNHRYRYLHCGNYLTYRATPVVWKGSLSKGAKVGGLDCRGVKSAYRTPLSNKGITQKTEGASQTVDYKLSSGPVSEMLKVALSETTSWSKTLTIRWRADPHTQNWLCWKPPYSSVANALEVFTSTAG